MKKKKYSVYTVTSTENTLRQMPRYNGFAVGHGAHKSARHPGRAERKARDRREIREQDDNCI